MKPVWVGEAASVVYLWTPIRAFRRICLRERRLDIRNTSGTSWLRNVLREDKFQEGCTTIRLSSGSVILLFFSLLAGQVSSESLDRDLLQGPCAGL